MYVDGFLLPLPKDKVDAYRDIASKAGQIWMEHGALGYYETVGDDLAVQGVLSFDRAADIKEGETPVFAFILYNSREHRDEVNQKVMADPKMKDCHPDELPFDMKRMYFSGFKGLVTLTK